MAMAFLSQPSSSGNSISDYRSMLEYSLRPFNFGTLTIDDDDPRRLFLFGIPTVVTPDDLLAQFSTYGPILDIKLLVDDSLSIYSRSAAFILFDHEDSVSNVYDDAPNCFILIMTKWVYISSGRPTEPSTVHIHNTMLFLTGIPYYLTKDDLENYFSTFGKVVVSEIVHDHVTKRSRGLGFIVFDKEDVIDEFFARRNRLDINGSNVFIEQAIPRWTGRLCQGVIFPRILTLVDNYINECHVFSEDLSTVLKTNFAKFSISKMVHGRFIFVILSDPEESEQSVRYFDFSNSEAYTLKNAPKLNFNKFNPTLIVMGSKIFVFSPPFYLVNKKSKDSRGHVGEMLETGAKKKRWNWKNLVPFPYVSSSKKVLESRFIVAFATEESQRVLHLTLGTIECFGCTSRYPSKGDFTITYYTDYGIWSNFSEESLPFYGEGKFLGSYCYGFPYGVIPFYPPYIGCFQVSGQTWSEVTRFYLPSGSPDPFRPYLQDFYLLARNIIVHIQARLITYEFETPRVHFLEVDVVQISETSKLLSHVTHVADDEFRDILGIRY